MTIKRIILIAACCITLVRSLGAFEIDIDQAIQLEAAERFTRGLGLTSTYFGSHPLDLVKPTTAENLTWFPPGFSLLIAGLTSLGLSLLASLRILYVSLTLAGWCGWALIAEKLWRQEAKHRERVAAGVLLLAVLAPIFLTPPWTGTDIFLWAALPCLVFWLVGSEQGRPYLRAGASGLLVGGLYSVRYGAGFLLVAGVMLITQATLPDVRAAVRRLAIFTAAGSVGIVLTMVYLARVSNQEIPGYVQPVSHFSDFAREVDLMITSLPAASTGLIGSPLLFKVTEKIQWRPLTYGISIICLVALLLMPVITLRRLGQPGTKPPDNVATSLALLPLGLVLFLTTMSILAPLEGQSLLGITRYYTPVSLCGVLVWALFTRRRTDGRYLQLAGRAVLVVFVAYYCAYLPALAFLRHDYVPIARAVLGTTPPRSAQNMSTSQHLGFPSNTLYSVKETSRHKVAELNRVFPDAVFYIDNYHHYVYGWDRMNGPVPGRDLRRFLQPRTSVRRGDAPRVPGASIATGLDFWRAAQVSRPLRVFWVLNAPHAVDFLPATNRRLVFEDPYEHTTILVSQFAAGEKLGGLLVDSRVTAEALHTP